MPNLSGLHRCLRSLCVHVLKTVTSDKWLVDRNTMRHTAPHSGKSHVRHSQLVIRHSPLATVLRNLALVTSHLALGTALTPLATAQTGFASLSGRVADHSGAVIQKAEVTLKSLDTGVVLASQTNNDGVYSFPSVQPGNYVMHVEKIGFRSVDVTGLTLYTQDQLDRNFSLEVGSASESVTVTGGTTNDSPAVGMTVTREFIENMPLNGQSLQDLIQLTPGAAAAQAQSSATNTGYYTINGQRTDANNYTVDGVSANLGGFNNSDQSIFSGISGSTPSQSVVGTTQSLVSIDALQEFTIQTSGYTAEYGRNPGGQVQFTTRSGTNDVHGSLSEYLRNTDFDANTYENDFYQIPQSPEHQNDFGGTIGGPLVIPKLYDGRSRTFYFLSYEGLRLILPAAEQEEVPTQAFRNWSSPNVQPFLNAAPLPSPNTPSNGDGCTIPDPATGQPAACDGNFVDSYSYPSKLNNFSARVDQAIGRRLHAFLRYADTPSAITNGVEQVATQTVNVHTWTAGLTYDVAGNLLNDFRFNYSHDGEDLVDTLRAVDGSVPWDRSLLVPAADDGPFDQLLPYILVPNTSMQISGHVGGGGSVQHQVQIVDGLSWTRNRHALKFGADWRRLTPTFSDDPYQDSMVLTSLANIQQGTAAEVLIAATAPGKPILDNLSLYAQDHWKIFPRLTADYGLRWEFNPRPGPSNGLYPATLTSSDILTAQLAPPGTPAFQTDGHSFAPRFGFAWNAIASHTHPLTVRGGFGIFFDTGQTTAAAAYAGFFPFFHNQPAQFNVPLPLSSTILAPPSLTTVPTPPYFSMAFVDPHLTMPYTEEWNISFDEVLSAKNTITVSYVGNNGKKLLYTESANSIPSNSDFSGVYYTYNGSSSKYNALQVVDTGRLTSGLDLVASFTWAHAQDNASTDYSQYSPVWGNSDNDLPKLLNLALNYQIPNTHGRHWMNPLVNGWLIANRFSAQSGYPLDLTQSLVALPNGESAEYGPDRVPGVPIYLHGSAADASGKPVPGDWRLNAAAFSLVPTDPTTGNPVRQGTLGRNFVRDPPFWALNTAVQRTFPIFERLQLKFRADAFNILNHPNLSYPDPYLSDSRFGEMLFGVTTTIGSSNELYAMGAARSLQFSLKLQF